MQDNSIAIIGMGCVYPGAHSPEELWENVLAGRRYFRISPDERLPNRYYYDPDPEAPGKTYCNRMAVITGWNFNPTDWKIPPLVFNESEIVHWLALHTSGEVLKDAGIDFDVIDKRRVGVIMGNSGIGEFQRSHLLRMRWPYTMRAIKNALKQTNLASQTNSIIKAVEHYYNDPLPVASEDHLPGNMANIIAGRISNYFDFRGPSYTVDGACASSLLAVVNACNHLIMSDADMVIAGGVDVSLDPLEVVGFAKTKALAKEDIRPYDERASGMQTGEGCGMLLLTTEQYAKKHDFRIHALLKGWGISADGSGGITQPKVEGQKYAIQKTYEMAGYNISSVGYIEGHGTGTAVGDKVELSAVREMLEQFNTNGNKCHIGSIKANIGHTKAAAGVAGMIKSVMALKNRILPPHINCYRPNSAFGSPLTSLRPSSGMFWDSKGPRRASVSAFGFGGVNVHITMEEGGSYDEDIHSDFSLLRSRQMSEVVLLSGKTFDEVLMRAQKLLEVAERMCQADLIDMSAALSKEKHDGHCRIALVASTPWQLSAQLRTVSVKLSEGIPLKEVNDPDNGIFAGEITDGGTIAALFPGQGSQRINMGIHWIRRYPFIEEMIAEFDSVMSEINGEGFVTRLYRDMFSAGEQEKKDWELDLRDTIYQQPSIISQSLAALQVLDYIGLKPDYAVGHSLGEISALAAGGALTPVDAIKIAVYRGRAMGKSGGNGSGGMAAVGKSEEEVLDLLEKYNLSLTISNINSPRQTVVSGSIEGITKLADICRQEGVWARQLPVSQAFHSPFVADAAEELCDVLKNIHFSKLQNAAVYSTVSGDIFGADTDIRSLLSDQVVQPVRFIDAIKKVAEKKPDMWIETGL